MAAGSSPHINLLILGYVWPEARSSAAGIRTEQVIRAAQAAGWAVTLASASKVNEAMHELQARGVRCVPILLNDPSFNAWVKSEKFDIVVFDRFVTEEQFGWRVAEASPEAIRVLDTMDLHFLRRARQKAVTQGTELDLMGDDCFREIASIYRSDLSLLVSDYELQLLQERFEVPSHLLGLSPIGYPAAGATMPFEARHGFATIGNFRHPPNADGNRWLKEAVWPQIRSRLPQATLHVYGAYPARADMELTDPSQGFFVEGPAPDALEALAKHRVVLAPLRFGAGIKGKIADAWRSGAPVVTTLVGAEGMRLGDDFGGLIAQSPEDLADAAAQLHQDEALWERSRSLGFKTLQEKLNEEKLNPELIHRLLELRENLGVLRSKSFVSRMLRQQAFQGTKYFSKWIELKTLAQVVAVDHEREKEPVAAAP